MVGGQQNDATEKTNPGTRGSGGGGGRDSITSAEVLQNIAVSTTTETQEMREHNERTAVQHPPRGQAAAAGARS